MNECNKEQKEWFFFAFFCPLHSSHTCKYGVFQFFFRQVRSFDRSRSGMLSVEIVIAGIRGRWSQYRMKLVEQAWRQLNPTGERSL